MSLISCLGTDRVPTLTRAEGLRDEHRPEAPTLNEAEIAAGLPVRRSISTPSAWAIMFVRPSPQTPLCSKSRLFSYTMCVSLSVGLVVEQANLSAAWKAVAEWFDGSVPPATLLGVARLGYVGQLVEVAATVLKA